MSDKTLEEIAEADKRLAKAGSAPPKPSATPIKGLVSIAKAVADVSEQWDKGPKPVVPLPWPDLRQHYTGGGLVPGTHVLIGAPASGKSQFAMNIAYHAAREGHPVLYISLDMWRDEVVARLLALESDTGTPWSELWSAKKEKREREAERRLARLPIYLMTPEDASVTINADVFIARVEALHEAHPDHKPMLVVLDYLQRVRSKGGGTQDHRSRIDEVAVAAQGVSVPNNAAVLLVSATSRGNYEGLGLAPSKKNENLFGKGSAASWMGAGKESGEIEYSAQSVLVLGEGEGDHDKGNRTLGLCKQKAGPGSVWLRFGFLDHTEFKPPEADKKQAVGGSLDICEEAERGEG